MRNKGPPDSMPIRFPVLHTESGEEFERFRQGYDEEIKPRGIIERQSVNEIIVLGWEIQRYSRAKTDLINVQFLRGLKNLLIQYSVLPSEADKLAQQWFTDESAKQRVLEDLKRFNLDEAVIASQAMRLCAAELQQIDQILASLQWRYKKALRFLAKFRGGLGQQLHAKLERIIHGKDPPLDDTCKKTGPEAG
jgi:hypothetical protein